MNKHPNSAAIATRLSANEHLKDILDHAAHLLPAQAPIGVFIHHNTLHAFQHLRFESAVIEASRRYGTEPYLSEEQFQSEYKRGRILNADIVSILESEPDTIIWPGVLTRRKLRKVMLIPGQRYFSAENIEWQIDENGLLKRLRVDLDAITRNTIIGQHTEEVAARNLFAACFHRLPYHQSKKTSRITRLRDALLAFTGEDIDEIIHPLLIQLCSVYLDQGLAYWPMPDRDQGFYLAARALLQQSFALESELLSGLQKQFRQQQALALSSSEVILHYLDLFQLAEKDWNEFITSELLALPGWAGLMRRLEEEPELSPHEQLPCSLEDFLAVRFTITAVAAENLWQRQKLHSPLWSNWRNPPQSQPASETEHLAAAAQLFEVAQLLGISSEKIAALSASEFNLWYEEVKLFEELERRRVFQLAYELRHEQQILGPLQQYLKEIDPVSDNPRPSAQVIFCIDEREESIRRALEEIAPEVETFGAVGYYGVAVNYKGLDDPHGMALCPIVVKPRHAVVEKPLSSDTWMHKKRQNLRKLWSNLEQNSFVGSRMLVRGWLGTAGFGILSLFPLITRTLAPRQSAKLVKWLTERLLPEPRTELSFMRHDSPGDNVTAGLLRGFSPQEKAERVASILRPAGMVASLARLVVVIGHGSTSLNNPHESAHDCGACGGRRGGPNARLFAAMANRPEVRARLREMGVEIPDDTWFIGAYHDTCNDNIEFFDEENLPPTHYLDFKQIQNQLDRARAANALERCRRFEAASNDKTPEQALRHVQERAEHLAEPRPEYGHCTNAICIVGRRNLTRGLFLDRRAFLVSYNPTLDSDNAQLAALLAAAGPVCAGINLEYYFSFVDNERYGCGTKLPHNITGLIGVMNGPASDLRTGLPWQMVEIHEPVRLLLIVESTPERLMQVVNQNALAKQLVENRWIRIATISPLNGEIQVYRDGSFQSFDDSESELPTIPASVDWYRNKLEHLPIARIKAASRKILGNGI
jgi:uncharacterized protein YbcC (UPF0753/DUF2309 family)